MGSKYFKINGSSIGDDIVDGAIFRVYVNDEDEITNIMLDPENEKEIGYYGMEYWEDEVRFYANEMLEELYDEIKFEVNHE